MKTKEEFESMLANLTELETADLCEALYAHLEKNKMGSLADVFTGGLGDEVNELEEKLASRDRDIEECEEEISDLKRKITNALVGFKDHEERFNESMDNLKLCIE